MNITTAIVFGYELDHGRTDAQIPQLCKSQHDRENEPQAVLLITKKVQIDRIADGQYRGVDCHRSRTGNHIDPELAGE